MTFAKKCQAWKSIKPGTRVQLRGNFRKGECGTVVEVLSGQQNGFRLHGVRLDISQNTIADCPRWELKVL